MSAILDQAKDKDDSENNKNYAYPSDPFLIAYSEARINRQYEERKKMLEEKFKEKR